MFGTTSRNAQPWIALCGIVIALAPMPVGAQSESDSETPTAVVNAGFEQWDDETSFPTGWSIAGSGHKLAADPDHFLSGQFSLSVSGDQAKSGTMVTQSIAAEGVHGAPTRLQGFIRTRGIEGTASLLVTVKGPDGSLFQDDMRNRPVRGDTDWHHVNLDIPTLPDAESVTVGAIVIGPGEAWFDALSFAERQTGAKLSDVARTNVEDTLDQMEQRYVDSDDIDWPTLRQQVMDAAAGSQTVEDTYPALTYAVSLLGDSHASFAQPKTTGHLSEVNGDDQAHIEFAMPSAGVVQLAVPPVHYGPESVPGKSFINQSNESIQSHTGQGACGWIVDLRSTTGGNMWTMLGALAPLLRAPTLGSFVDASGNTATWQFAPDAISVQTPDSANTRVAIDAPFTINETARIAVLYSGDTSSSGEATAIAFQGAPNTRTFGTPTGGYTTANTPIPVGSGAALVLPTSRMADRNGREIEGSLKPDVLIDDDAGSAIQQDILSQATNWVLESSTCSAVETKS